MEYSVVDVETNGLNFKKHSIIEIAIIHRGKDSNYRVAIDSLLKPKRPIRNRLIHGINNRMVRNAPNFADIATEIKSNLQDRLLIGHNISFDVRFLYEEFRRIGECFSAEYLCTLRLGEKLFGNKYSLKEAIERFQIKPLGLLAHRAKNDAYTTMMLFEHYMNEIRRNGKNGINMLKFENQIDAFPKIGGLV